MIIYVLLKTVAKLFFRLNAKGLENIPSSGSLSLLEPYKLS